MYHQRVLLDVQCFKDNVNNFIIKEVAAINIDHGTLLFHHIASPPCDFSTLSIDKQRENKWLTRSFHGLPWNSGDIPYTDLVEKLCNLLYTSKTVFVKGLEKRQFIRSLARLSCDIIDLTSLGCYSLTHLSETCIKDSLKCNNHKSLDYRCALSNAINLRKWYILNTTL